MKRLTDIGSNVDFGQKAANLVWKRPKNGGGRFFPDRKTSFYIKKSLKFNETLIWDQKGSNLDQKGRGQVFLDGKAQFSKKHKPSFYTKNHQNLIKRLKDISSNVNLDQKWANLNQKCPKKRGAKFSPNFKPQFSGRDHKTSFYTKNSSIRMRE